MHKTVFALLLAALATSASAINVRDYERQRDSADVKTFAQTRNYLVGVVTGYTWANNALAIQKAKPLYCASDPNAPIDVTAVIDDEITKPYVTKDLPVEMLLLGNLIRSYPCPGPTNGGN